MGWHEISKLFFSIEQQWLWSSKRKAAVCPFDELTLHQNQSQNTLCSTENQAFQHSAVSSGAFLLVLAPPVAFVYIYC